MLNRGRRAGFGVPAETRRWVLLAVLMVLSPSRVTSQEAFLDVLPLRPFNFDVVFRQQTFAPDDREIGIQAGFTAL
ncbi:MAG TPA: hypothetical protein VNK46_10955 [Nitrospiraceae bacterium]|jgi:hypothetical protein|nr:hypothetical protein [Nitrospiraceae bacterium]